jgi:hypothetical protein
MLQHTHLLRVALLHLLQHVLERLDLGLQLDHFFGRGVRGGNTYEQREERSGGDSERA